MGGLSPDTEVVNSVRLVGSGFRDGSSVEVPEVPVGSFPRLRCGLLRGFLDGWVILFFQCFLMILMYSNSLQESTERCERCNNFRDLDAGHRASCLRRRISSISAKGRKCPTGRCRMQTGTEHLESCCDVDLI